MELVGTKARVMLAYPPDTDTPGLQMENTTKPEETKIISGSGGLHSPEKVGAKMIHDAMVIKLHINNKMKHKYIVDYLVTGLNVHGILKLYNLETVCRHGIQSRHPWQLTA